MKKRILLAGILAVCSWCSAAENLIKNPDYSEKSPAGLPMHWSFANTTGTRQKSENGIIRITPKFAAVQHNIKIEANKSYLLSYEAKGSPDATFQLYSSWQEGEKNRGYTDAGKKKGTEEFVEYKFLFNTGDNARG